MAVIGKLDYREGPLAVANGKSSTEERWLVYSDDPDNDDRDDALTWVLNNGSTTLYGLVRDRVTIGEKVHDIVTQNYKQKIWPVVVKFVNPQRRKPRPIEVDEEAPSDAPQKTRLSIRTGGATSRRLTYSRTSPLPGEIANPGYAWGTSNQQIGRGLNFKSDDSEDTGSMFIAQGINVPGGSVEIVVETVRLNDSIDVDGYLVKATELANKQVINSKVYKGFPAQSLQLINFSSSQRGGDESATDDNTEPWDVVYTFRYEAEISNTDLNDNKPPGLENQTWSVGKKGFQYLDITYVNTEVEEINTGAKFIMPQAQRAAIHDIFEAVDFEEELKI